MEDDVAKEEGRMPPSQNGVVKRGRGKCASVDRFSLACPLDLFKDCSADGVWVGINGERKEGSCW